MVFYTYLWKDSEGRPFYVGKGSKKRAHAISGRSPEFAAVYAAGGCTLEIVDEFIHESQAHAHEVDLIELYGRRELGGLLVNKTDGGEGASGWVPSLEWREKHRLSRVGKPHSEATKAKIGAANRGKVRGDDFRARMRVIAGGRSAETLAKMGSWQIGRKLPLEHRQKIGDSLRGRVGTRHTEETKAKISFSKTGVSNPFSLNHRAAISLKNRIAGPRADNKTGFKGVSFHSKTKKWHAQIMTSSLGYFSSSIDAAKAYDIGAIERCGHGNCYLNFPNDPNLAASA